MGEKRPPMLFNGYRIVAPKGNIMSSKDVYVYAKGEDDISMQIRSFDDLSGYQGELIGTVAKYGKIASALMYAWKGGLKTGVYYTRTKSKLEANSKLASNQITQNVEKPKDSQFECFGCSA